MNGESDEWEGPWRILVVGAPELVAERLRILSETYPDIVLVGDVTEGAMALSVAARVKPHVVMVGEGPRDADGFKVCDRIHRLSPAAAVVFVSHTITDAMTLLAVEAGSCGIVSPVASDDELMLVVLRAAQGEFLLPRDVVLRLFNQERELRLHALSARGLGRCAEG